MRILYIDIDTLRPDHMGCYGYRRNTTPNIDKIAEEGVRFNRYYCSDAPCLLSRESLISVMFGIKHERSGTVVRRRICVIGGRSSPRTRVSGILRRPSA